MSTAFLSTCVLVWIHSYPMGSNAMLPLFLHLFAQIITEAMLPLLNCLSCFPLLLLPYPFIEIIYLNSF
jgi:hypothetical protein